MPAAVAQLDYVLQVNPTNPAAVVTRSYILLKAKQHDQASAILRKAIELVTQKKEKQPAVFYLDAGGRRERAGPRPRRRSSGPSRFSIKASSRCPTRSSWCRPSTTALKAAGQIPSGAIEFVEAKAKAFPKGSSAASSSRCTASEKLYDQADRACSASCSRSRPTTPTWRPP